MLKHVLVLFVRFSFATFGMAYRKLLGIKNRDSRESQIFLSKKNYQHRDKNIFCTCTKIFFYAHKKIPPLIRILRTIAYVFTHTSLIVFFKEIIVNLETQKSVKKGVTIDIKQLPLHLMCQFQCRPNNTLKSHISL